MNDSKFNPRALLLGALSNEPFTQMPVCTVMEPVAEGERVIGDMTEHPDLIRLMTLRNEIVDRVVAGKDAMQSDLVLEQSEDEKSSARLKVEELGMMSQFGKGVNEIMWAMVRERFPDNGSVIGFRAGWKVVVTKEEGECNCPPCQLKRALMALARGNRG